VKVAEYGYSATYRETGKSDWPNSKKGDENLLAPTTPQKLVGMN